MKFEFKKLFPIVFIVLMMTGCFTVPDIDPDVLDVLIAYPNPADQRVNIYVRNDELHAYDIRVFDPRAKLILEENIEAGNAATSFSVDLSERDKGIYQIILTKNSAIYNRKFFKI